MTSADRRLLFVQRWLLAIHLESLMYIISAMANRSANKGLGARYFNDMAEKKRSFIIPSAHLSLFVL